MHGLNPLERDFSNVHTWPCSYHLVRQCSGVGGWGKVQLQYKLCRCGRRKYDQEGRDRQVRLLILSRSPDPFALLGPIRLPHPLRSFFSYSALLRPPLPRHFLLPVSDLAPPRLSLPRDCIGCLVPLLT